MSKAILYESPPLLSGSFVSALDEAARTRAHWAALMGARCPSGSENTELRLQSRLSFFK